MNFIDRLLQQRKIVTKVLIFVVPMVLLITGVGVAGYYTATTLNGHMTVTRATIENIGDLENLQVTLQDFLTEPSESTVNELRSSIARQAKGSESLEKLLVTDKDHERISVVTNLAASMSLNVDKLWAIRSDQVRNTAETKSAIDAIADLAAAVNKQVGNLQKAYEAKERFAKNALFEAYAYKTIGNRVQPLREALEAENDDTILSATSTFALILKQEFNKLSGKANLERVKPVLVAAEEILATTAGKLPQEEKIGNLRTAAKELTKLESELNSQALTKASDAAGVFFDLENEMVSLRNALRQIALALEGVDTLRLDVERFIAQPGDAVLTTLSKDMSALRTLSVEVSSVNFATREFAPNLASLLDRLSASARLSVDLAKDWRAARTETGNTLSSGMSGLKNFVANAQEVGKGDSEASSRLSIFAMVMGTVLATGGGLMLVETLRGPLRRVTEVMKRLAAGELDVEIKGCEREDEIGDMVRSVAVFRDAAVENVRLGKEAAAAHAFTTAEAERRTAERARITSEQQQALTALSDVLNRLAEGDLECRMESCLPDDFVEMARTYNDAVEALRLTLADVRAAAVDIDGSTGNLAASADDLARRTEQQAAALEESSRSLRHLSEIVRSTAEGASQTAVTVNETEEFAVRSGEIVGRAIEAMGDISASSARIATIIGVIDEIAFQTNLLALNAGVEAARAGEAGKGFAVVAQEVRELAQRCASAAREIKELISASSVQVSNGVELVEQTGSALREIISHISDVRHLVAQISVATSEQSTGIIEITEAVHNVELVTQHNAAMVEENNAELGSLRTRVESLSSKVDHFKLGTQARLGQGLMPNSDLLDKNHAA